MRHQRVLIRRDNFTTHNKTVCPWEIPILEAVFDEGNVEVKETFAKVGGVEYPDAAQEFERLEKVYGKDKETKQAWVVVVYGASRAGVRALAKAIAEAKQSEKEAKATAGEKRTEASEHDPLFA